MRRRIVLLCLGLLAALAFSAPAVFADSTLNVTRHTQDEIREHVSSSGCTLDEVYSSVTYAAQPSASDPFVLGKLSATTLNEALAQLNNIRYIAGLDPVTLDSQLTDYAQGASLICAANNKMQHTGHTQPAGMDDALFATCTKGAAETNLAYGYGNVTASLLYGWLDDSDQYNIDRLGHRRWVLNPTMGKTGFGHTSIYSAMYSIDGFAPANQTLVAWPAQQTPIEYLKSNPRSTANDTYAWSLSTGSEQVADSITVTLTRTSDGKVWSFSSSSADGYFNVENNGYGQKGCIIFCPSDICYRAGDAYHVKVEGTTAGTIEYDVNLFALDEAPLAAMDQIDAIPASVALTDEAAITAARAAYDALTSGQQSRVANLRKLTAAETTLKKLKEDKAAADAVIAKINDLPEASSVKLTDETAIEAARAAYKALTKDQKALVSETDLKKLTDAEAAIAGWAQYNADAANAGTIAARKVKVKNVKGKKVNLTWKKAVSADGTAATSYQIKYSTDKKFKKGIKTKKAKGTATKLTIKSLKKNKTYYVKITPMTKVTNTATGATTNIPGKATVKKVKVKK